MGIVVPVAVLMGQGVGHLDLPVVTRGAMPQPTVPSWVCQPPAMGAGDCLGAWVAFSSLEVLQNQTCQSEVLVMSPPPHTLRTPIFVFPSMAEYPTAALFACHRLTGAMGWTMGAGHPLMFDVVGQNSIAPSAPLPICLSETLPPCHPLRAVIGAQKGCNQGVLVCG